MNYYDPLQYNPYLKPPQQPVDGLTWVDGIDEVNSYPLPPNSQSPALMWREEPKFSIKRTDNYGGYTVRTFSFTEDEPEPVRSSYGQQQAATHQPSSMDALREQYRSAMPDERERMKHEALQLFGMM